MRRLAILALVAGAPPALAAPPEKPAAPKVPGLVSGTRCEQVALGAEELVCDDDKCLLTGKASLLCEELKVWADNVEIQLTPDRRFAGATAMGNVILVEKNRVISCERVWVGPDRIQARLDDAVVRVKKGTETLPNGMPIGRDQARFSGDVERLDAQHLHIEDVHFTLCDCGEDLPSWEVRAGEADADLKDRVTIWWPTFWIDPFGIGTQVPILPPIPFVSVPLKDRAAGQLPPVIRFYRFPYPLLDFPVFVPLGDSYDLTVIPGLRTDWTDATGKGFQRFVNQLSPPSRWGAPRLGGRLRYAPVQGTTGTLNVSWTHDPKHGAARARELYNAEAACRARGIPLSECDTPPPYSLELYKQAVVEREIALAECAAAGIAEADCTTALPLPGHPRGLWEIEDRLGVTLQHRSELGKSGLFTANGEWFSDDAYRDDFGLTVAERAAGEYVPSRTQLAFFGPSGVASVAADYLLVLGNSNSLKNFGGLERWEPHRGPAMRLHLTPVPLGGPLHWDGDLSFVRYGPWASDVPLTLPTAPQRQTITGAATGISVMERLGPIEAQARLGFDGLWVEPELAEPFGSSMLLASGELSTRLWRHFGDLTHVVQPRVSYLAVPWRDGPVIFTPDSPDLDEDRATNVALVDERLRREATSHQVMLSLDQELRSRSQQRRLLSLELSQPFDATNGEAFSSSGAVVLSTDYGSLRANASYYLPDQELRELGGGLSTGFRFGGVSLGYTRIGPNAGRFNRTMYELEAPPERVIDNAGFVHYGTADVVLRWPPLVTLTYQTAYYFPVPGVADRPRVFSTPILPTPPVLEPQFQDRGFTTHRFTIAYNSPCECWGISVSGEHPHELPNVSLTRPFSVFERMSFGVNLTVAGYGLGAAKP